MPDAPRQAAGGYIPGGYALMPRCLFESDFWATASPLCRCVWVYLWGKANHKAYKKIQRGQIRVTVADIQDALTYRIGNRPKRPDYEAVRRSLRKLSESQMITKAKTGRGMVITVVNYDRYQNPASYESRSENRAKAKRKPSEGTNHIQEGNKGEGKEDNGFVRFWDSYPRKVGKGKAVSAYTKALAKASSVDIATALAAQAAAWKTAGKETQFIPHASTWLNGERWNDEIETPAGDPLTGTLAERLGCEREPTPAEMAAWGDSAR